MSNFINILVDLSATVANAAPSVFAILRMQCHIIISYSNNNCWYTSKCTVTM